MSHFLQPIGDIGKIVGVSNGNLKTSLNSPIHTGNLNCLAQRGDRITFWEEGFLSSLKTPSSYINIAGRCLECERLCPFSVNSLSNQARSINVRTQGIGVEKQMPRKELTAISIYGNGDVITYPDLFFEV